MEKYTTEQFAALIRNKHPKAYNDLSDKELVDLWIKKHPGDADLIKESGRFDLFNILFWGAVIWLVLSLFDAKVSKIDFVSEINQKFLGSYKISGETIDQNNEDQEIAASKNTDSSNSSDNIYDIAINEDISLRVDTNVIIKDYNISEELKTKIKKILSDPNPDPENKIGAYCGDYVGNCKWCNSEIRQPQEFATAQSMLSSVLFNPLGMYLLALSFTPETYLKEICEQYESNNKYVCQLPGSKKDFCSLKCEKEYKYR